MEGLTSPGLPVLWLCLPLTVLFISESLIVSDSWSKYKVLPFSLGSAVQTPFPSGFQVQVLVAD